MSKYVLDASAILALLNREAGWETVEQLLSNSTVSTVNLAEVLSKLIENGLSPDEAVEAVDLLQLDIVPFTETHAREAARLRTQTKKLGLSLGDRSCLALAAFSQAIPVTADKSWASLDFTRVLVIR